MRRSPGPMRWVASSTNTTASASARVPSTRRFRRSPRAVRGRCRPGVSTKTSWASGVVSTPRMVLRVVWGRDEVMATLVPTRALTRVDLPTLGRPTTATNPDFTSG